jgi:hypothetical protein
LGLKEVDAMFLLVGMGVLMIDERAGRGGCLRT